jgi:hypothetical protein
MRKTLILVATAILLTGTAITGSAVARDRIGPHGINLEPDHGSRVGSRCPDEG